MSQEYLRLTKRQSEVLRLISREFTTKEICSELRISKSAVQVHKSALFEKLGVRSSLGLVLACFKRGILVLKKEGDQVHVVIRRVDITHADHV